MKTIKLMWLRMKLWEAERSFDAIHKTNMAVQANARAVASVSLEEMQRESIKAAQLRVRIATLEGGV